MEKTLEKSRKVSDLLLRLVDTNMCDIARDLTKDKSRHPEFISAINPLYIPCSMTPQDFQYLLSNPESLELESQNGNNNREPIYGDYSHAIQGRNQDGSLHKGFVLISTHPTGDFVYDLSNRNLDSQFSDSFRKEYIDGLMKDLEKSMETYR